MLEKQVNNLSLIEFLEQETKPQKVRFWGEDYVVTPALVSEMHGDGLQIVWLSSIYTRPNYYILRIDSSIDLDNDESLSEKDQQNYGAVYELLLNMIEDEYDSLDRYEEGENGLYYEPDYPDIEPFEYEFPMLNWGGGSWGMMANFRTGETS